MWEASLSSRPIVSMARSTDISETHRCQSDGIGQTRRWGHVYRGIHPCFARRLRCRDRRNRIEISVLSIGHFSMANISSWRPRCTAGPTLSPSSSSVRSSTLAAMTFHRASTSAKRPLKAGLAAVNASYCQFPFWSRMRWKANSP